MAVITRWSYKRGGRKVGFHCTLFQTGGKLSRTYHFVPLFYAAGLRELALCPVFYNGKQNTLSQFFTDSEQ